MSNAAPVLDGLFRALADPTRRAVVARLAGGPAAMGELKRPFAMAPPSFLQHLNVLERSGLVVSHKTGRVRVYRLQPKKLRAVESWLGTQRAMRETRLDQLDSYLASTKDQPT